MTPRSYRDGGSVVVMIDDEDMARSARAGHCLTRQGRLFRNVFLVRRPPFPGPLYRRKHDAGRDATDGAAAPSDDPMNLLAPSVPYRHELVVAPIRTDLRADTLPTLCADEPSSDMLGLEDPESLIREFRAFRDSRGPKARVGLVGWWGCGDRYPLRLGPGAQESTPAMALLEAYCTNPARQQPGCALLEDEARIEEPAVAAGGAFTTPLVVRWGAFPPAQQRPFYSAGVCQPYADESGGVPWWHAFRTSVRSCSSASSKTCGIRHGPLALPCPPSPCVGIIVVRYGDPEGSARSSGQYCPRGGAHHSHFRLAPSPCTARCPA